jgi:hypothetical protein
VQEKTISPVKVTARVSLCASGRGEEGAGGAKSPKAAFLAGAIFF